MTFFWRTATVIVASVVFLLACSAAAQTTAPSTPGSSAAPTKRTAPRAAGHRRAVSKPSPVPAAPQPPPPPPTPEQMPPVPPQVTYSNGLLTIVAGNSTLSDILHAVSIRTGATVDAPAHLTGERVAARIGPGTPREVLSDLLSGPGFDYILVGSDGDPNAVRSIILTPNQSSPSGGAAMAQRQPVRAVTPPQEEMDEEIGEPQFQGGENPQPAQQPPPAQTFGPQQPFGPQLPPDQMGGQQPASPEGGTAGQQVKTPEQLLQELRRMQQQGNQPQNEPQR